MALDVPYADEGEGGGGARCERTVKLRKKLDQIMCKMSDLTLCTFNIIFSDKQLLLNWITFRISEWRSPSSKGFLCHCNSTIRCIIYYIVARGGEGGTKILPMNEKRSTSG